jgi:hypothetical protein
LTVDRFPDETERKGPAVDAIVDDSIGSIVAEHTVVESYTSQIHDNVRMQQVFDGFADRFVGVLEKPGRYTLVLNTQAGHQFPRGAACTSALRAIEDWILSQPLPVAEPPRQLTFVRASPPETPISVTLTRANTTPDWDGTLGVAFSRPADLERRRIDRLRVALEAEYPKLAASTPPGGASLLVLELRDYVLSSPWHVAGAIYRAAEDRDDVPDNIVVVDTGSGRLPYLERREQQWSHAPLGSDPSA